MPRLPKKSERIRRHAAVLLGSGLIALTGCSAAAAPSFATTNKNASVTVAVPFPATLDAWATSGADRSISRLVFSGLMKLGPGDAPIPDLATHVQGSKDGKTLTFTLRRARWQSGQWVTAKDVAATFTAALKLPSSSLPKPFGAITGVKATGARTVVFSLSAPDPDLLAALATNSPVLPATAIVNGKLGSPKFWARPDGSGPFRVKSASAHAIVLTRFDRYYGGKPKVPGLRLVPEPSADTAPEAFAHGVDVLSADGVSPSAWQGATLLRSPSTTYYYAALNQDNPDFRAAKFREALLAAIDRNAINVQAFHSDATVATGPLPPGSVYAEPGLRPLVYDPGLAEQLLKRLGYHRTAKGLLPPGKHSPVSLTLVVGNLEPLPAIAKIVQHDWQALGIKVTRHVVSWDAWISLVMVERSYTATIGFWTESVPPQLAATNGASAAETGYNVPDVRDTSTDTLLHEIASATSFTDRVQATRRLDAHVARTLPYLYLINSDDIWAVSPSLKGVTPGDLDVLLQSAAHWSWSGG